MDHKIINGRLLLRKNGRLTAEPGTLTVKDGRIFSVGAPPPPDGTRWTVLDAKDRLVMPGLVNMHTHLYMTALRNRADDVPFTEWLFQRVAPLEEAMTPEEAYWSCLLGCMEMLLTGTTCFVDMHMFRGQSARAAAECGLRAFIGRGLVGEDLYTDGRSRFDDFLWETENCSSDRIRTLLSPHAIYTCSETLLRQVAAEAEKGGLLKQIHLSESAQEVRDCLAKHGKTPVAYLEELGFLDERTILAHCVKLTQADMEILARTGAHAVTNPASNAMLGNGFAPVVELKKRGVNVCIGTDSAASNDTLNLFREMGLLSLIQKGRAEDPTALIAPETLAMATENAAKALGMAGSLGTLAPGAQADLIFIDLRAPSLTPNADPVAALCYSACGAEVTDVMVAGRVLLRDRDFVTIDKERVLYEIGGMMKKKMMKKK